MRFFSFLLPWALNATPAVIPTPQSVEWHGAPIVFSRSEPITILTTDRDSPTFKAVVALISRELPGWNIEITDRPPAKRPAIVLWNCEKRGVPDGRNGEAVLDSTRYFGQSYLLETHGNQVRIAGATAIGVLYGAATLAQLFEPSRDGIRVPGATIRDYPSFRYRAASDWLLRAELNRWAYDWGDGNAAYAERIRRKLDFCARFKINMVMFDGFGWSPNRTPGYAPMMRALNQYARERGIKLMFSGFGANFDPRKVEPEFHIGSILLNRRSYPYGPVYSCFGEGRTPEHPTYGTCRSNTALLAEIAREFDTFVRAVEPGALYVHHEDTGHYQTTQVRWADRCEDCKRRWPNPDFAAPDGGAGAMANGYRNILQAVQQVRNHDSGYDAARDCAVVFISPPYGVDSQRSGMGAERVDPDLGWNKTLEFWTNVLAQMPKTPNLEVGFREIFANREGKQWVEAYRERMTARGLNPNMFIFFLGGADQYSNGSFNYPVTGSSVMNGIFDGAESMYNFNGGLHQETQQVINAEYSWNSHGPGRMTPSTFEEGLRHWRALMKNEELPEAVFGADGFFPRACALVYGRRAGAAMSKYFSYYEERVAGELPDFYPRKAYPLVVLWRCLEGDRAYWDVQPSAVEQRALEALNIPRAELQRRLAGLWRQTANVNEKAEKLLVAAGSSGDLRQDARQDLERLRLSNQVGQRMAALLAAYHDRLAGAANRQDVLGMNTAFLGWLRSRARFDFTDPKGGDAASWIESSEILRSHLLAGAH
jgi:hypothetical protein